MPSSLLVNVRSLGFSGAFGSCSWSWALRCSLRWAFSACFSWRCRSFCRFAKVVRELPAMSTPETAEFERRANQARPFLYCTLSSVVVHLQRLLLRSASSRERQLAYSFSLNLTAKTARYYLAS